ncbi:related to GAL4-like transcriptional activator [Cephalotrichum gorgonifer]|uniref:Related to GAL4-like transcriptional activator n=1 Tax=Cephalotrichum gorgonifer TaxID=2041049 RepID=A0AAE8N3Q0_9PEZI|nr:related to GAL4-like transcriptional activator [Cephalotrichum gorgonifer]
MALHDGEPLPANPDRKDSLAAIRVAVRRKAEMKQEKADLDSLVSDFGLLSVGATSRDAESSISGGSAFAKLMAASCFRHRLPSPRDDALPPRQEAHALVQYYMDNIYALYPAFPETAIWATLDNIYQAGGDQALSNADHWLFWTVLAVASSAQSRSSQDEFYNRGVDFIARAVPYAEKVLTPGAMSTIPSLVLLTQYAMYDPRHFDTWHCMGFTARVVLEMGLHQDPPSHDVRDKNDLETRRKMFHCVYALDRTVSMGHARSFSFTDSAVDVALPSSSGLGRIPSISGHIRGPQSNSPALHLFQLRRLQSGWYQTLYQSGTTVLPDGQSFLWKACHELREWAELLPPSLPSDVQRLFNLELEWSYVYCLMPSTRAPQATEYRQSLLFEHAVSFIEQVHESAFDTRSAPFTTYYDVMRVYFIGTQLVSLLRAAFDLIVSGRPVLMPQSDGGGVPAPPLPHRFFQLQFEDNLQRSMKAMRFVHETLARFGERWEDALRLLEVFEGMGGEVRGMLDRRAAEVQQQQQQMQHMQQQIQHPQYPQHP